MLFPDEEVPLHIGPGPQRRTTRACRAGHRAQPPLRGQDQGRQRPHPDKRGTRVGTEDPNPPRWPPKIAGVDGEEKGWERNGLEEGKPVDDHVWGRRGCWHWQEGEVLAAPTMAPGVTRWGRVYSKYSQRSP